MTDRELQGLLDMCRDLDAIEGGVERPLPKPVPATLGGAMVFGRRLAVAAALLLAAGSAIVLTTRRAPTPNPMGPLAIETSVSPASTEPFVLLTIFQELDGGCQCVTRREFEPEPGRQLFDLSRSELIDLALADSCMTSAERVVVIGVSGPRGDLPRTQHEAEALAHCLDTCVPEGFPDGIVPAAVDCLPASVSVVTEVLALGLR